MDDLEARLVECFAAVFPDLGAEQIPQASPDAVAAWDSLAAVKLVTVIEEAFDLAVQPAEQERLVSFERILDYVRSHAAGGRSSC
jgi:acyl carrier protein